MRCSTSKIQYCNFLKIIFRPLDQIVNFVSFRVPRDDEDDQELPTFDSKVLFSTVNPHFVKFKCALAPRAEHSRIRN